MRKDISKESLEQAISELKTRDAVAAHFGLKPRSLYHYLQRYELRIEPQPMRGRNGEAKVYAWLKKKGFDVYLMEYTSPFDLRCNDKRVEVKRAGFSDGLWRVNIHRHGKVRESEVDFYVIRLEDVPFSKAAIHLVIPAPIGKPTLAITPRSLLTKYAQHFNRLDLLR